MQHSTHYKPSTSTFTYKSQLRPPLIHIHIQRKGAPVLVHLDPNDVLTGDGAGSLAPARISSFFFDICGEGLRQKKSKKFTGEI